MCIRPSTDSVVCLLVSVCPSEILPNLRSKHMYKIASCAFASNMHMFCFLGCLAWEKQNRPIVAGYWNLETWSEILLQKEFVKLDSSRFAKYITGSILLTANFWAKMFLISRRLDLNDHVSPDKIQTCMAFIFFFHLTQLHFDHVDLAHKTQWQRNSPSRLLNKPTVEIIEASQN